MNLLNGNLKDDESKESDLLVDSQIQSTKDKDLIAKYTNVKQ